MVLADIPGLIEGASEGRGLGHQFLRHVERAQVLLVLVDLAPWDGVAPHEQLQVLLGELGSYQPDLLDRPRLVVGSRADMAPGHSYDGLAVSSVTGSGISELIGALVGLVSESRAREPEAIRTTIHRPVSGEIQLRRHDDGSWEVMGRAAQRAVALSDLTDDQALAYATERLQQLGVNTALARAGLRNGDEVRIGDFSFEYEEDS